MLGEIVTVIDRVLKPCLSGWTLLPDSSSTGERLANYRKSCSWTICLIACFLLAAVLLPIVVSLNAVHAEDKVLPIAQRDPLAIYVVAGATPEQVQKIQQQVKEFEDQSKVEWQLLKNLHQQLHDLSLQVDPEEKGVLSTQEEINKVIAQMATERIKLMLKIRAVLNSQQKQKLVELMQPRKEQPVKQVGSEPVPAMPGQIEP